MRWVPYSGTQRKHKCSLEAPIFFFLEDGAIGISLREVTKKGDINIRAAKNRCPLEGKKTTKVHINLQSQPPWSSQIRIPQTVEALLRSLGQTVNRFINVREIAIPREMLIIIGLVHVGEGSRQLILGLRNGARPKLNTGGYDSYEQGCTALTEHLAYIDTFIDNTLRFPGTPFVHGSLRNELSLLHRASRHLGLRWNVSTPIYRVPQDVLAYIFEIIYFMDYTVPVRGDALRVITLSHVCRLWRQVTLNHASLWTTIDIIDSVQWARTALARSRAAPVYISLYNYCPCDGDGASLRKLSPVQINDLASLISAHLHHFRQMSVTGCSCDIYPVVVSCSDIPAPTMEALAITVRAHQKEDNDSDDGRSITLSPSFLSENAPKLRSVELQGCFLPWTSPLLRNLTNLEMSLKEHHTASLTFGSAADLILSLQAMPALTSLRLSYCFPPDLVSFPASHAISLPLLTDLGISGSFQECKALFRILDTPSSTSLTLTCSSTDDTGAECCTILPRVSAYLFQANRAGLHLSKFSLSHFPSMSSLEIRARAHEYDLGLYDREAVLNLSFSWPESPGDTHLPTIEKFCDAVKPYVESLEVVRVTSMVWSPEHWTTYFARATHALCVHGGELAGKSLSQVIAARTSSDLHPASNTPSGLFFPELSVLTLSWIELMDEPEPVQDAFWGGLVSRLNERASAGAEALDGLLFIGCAVPLHMEKKLSEIVHVEHLEEDLDEEEEDRLAFCTFTGVYN
ncbi:hypothetical protein OF83DRAFT_1288836 [Amylostereum chailletii]|nr:hypothetical protein OF83DRAFT_1288836 [Amylostereum chailletii]